MFGDTPSYGFFIRHVKGLRINDVSVSYLKDDARSPFVLNDVNGIDVSSLKAKNAPDVPAFLLRDVQDFKIQASYPLPDKRIENIKTGKF